MSKVILSSGKAVSDADLLKMLRLQYKLLMSLSDRLHRMRLTRSQKAKARALDALIADANMLGLGVSDRLKEMYVLRAPF